MDVSIWSILLLLTKLVSYVGIAAFIGGGLVTYLQTREQGSDTTKAVEYRSGIYRWQLKWVVASLVVALWYLPLQAGSMAEVGFSGMFDSLMLNIAWQSVLGTHTLWRIMSLVLALGWLVWIYQRQRHLLLPPSLVQYSVGVIIGLIFAASFSLSGHSVELGAMAQALLTLHVFALASWAGAIWPLYASCRQLPSDKLGVVMHQFGQVAMFIVASLIVCGAILIFMLVDSIGELFTSRYGQLLLLKLTLVASMLLLGAWHKFSLVPELIRNQNPSPLKKSIAIEGLIGIGVLITTSIFTTLVGPVSH
ncbi:CopD family protein [uncultured Paraglaciecola sp.]|uniref:copper resistance D family protein n=1 Tax=uncultured Paraglaciecola sp. TaxID=1765024 RepID=UPI0030DD3D52|tara:strand:- start:4952 stop:5872 length:921 start_codon:yes stop_codon:yes gene_type:complete